MTIVLYLELSLDRRAAYAPISDAIVCGLGTAFFGAIMLFWFDALFGQRFLVWPSALGALFLAGAFIGAFFTRRGEGA